MTFENQRIVSTGEVSASEFVKSKLDNKDIMSLEAERRCFLAIAEFIYVHDIEFKDYVIGADFFNREEAEDFINKIVQEFLR